MLVKFFQLTEKEYKNGAQWRWKKTNVPTYGVVEYIRSKREIRLRVKFDQKLFSFRGVTVSVSVDGVEDDVITCMKEGKEAFPAKPLILTQTQQLLKDDQEGDTDTDPFADLDEEDPEEWCWNCV